MSWEGWSWNISVSEVAPLSPRAPCAKILQGMHVGWEISHMLDWTDLQYLAAFGADGTLSGAGRRLGADHATVARRIAALEAEKRRPSSWISRGPPARPDRGGPPHSRPCPGMDEEAQALSRALAAESGTLSGHFSLSAPPSFSAAWIAPQTGPFLAAHPGLTLSLIGETRITSLGRGEADVVHADGSADRGGAGGAQGRRTRLQALRPCRLSRRARPWPTDAISVSIPPSAICRRTAG